jgi:hypothetical protein
MLTLNHELTTRTKPPGALRRVYGLNFLEIVAGAGRRFRQRTQSGAALKAAP